MSNESSSAKHSDDPGSRRKEISADDVVAYLRSHPEFFHDRDSLLAELTVPHESGKAVSLLERQVQILRNRSIESRHTLNALLENARYNDQLFNVTRNLTLTLLDETDLQQIVSTTEANLSTQPGIDACRLIFLDPGLQKTDQRKRNIDIEEVQQRFPSLFRSRNVLCQSIDRDTARLLFPAHGSPLRSVALCPIRDNAAIIGILALGNHASDHFTSELDTLFLDFIGDILGTIIGRTG